MYRVPIDDEMSNLQPCFADYIIVSETLIAHIYNRAISYLMLDQLTALFKINDL